MKITMSALLVIAIGGAVGAICRYLVTVAMSRQFGDGFPWGTLTVNVVGALLIGMIVTWVDRSIMTEQQRLLLMVGFLGALTTFSSFSLDAYNLYKNGQMSAAALYILASNTLAIVAVFGGVWLGRAIGSGETGAG
jgi:CrcB protein